MMTRREANTAILAGAAAAAAAPLARAQATPSPRALPPPRATGGRPLIDALRRRHSTREYTDRAIAPQVLSDLLWAAYGVNRPNGDRTAPYWRHVMVIDVYAAMADGVWLYEPASHALLPHAKDDLRAQTGTQDFVATAPLDLIYVAHGERMTDVKAEERRLYASVDAGFIGQNVYLFCASEGLATVFRGAVDQAKLARALKLPDTQFVTFAQTVGYAGA
jgi:nitroreductase